MTTGAPDVLRLGVSAQVTFHRVPKGAPGPRQQRSLGTYPLRWSDATADGMPVLLAPVAADRAVWLSLRSVEPVALQLFVDDVNACTGNRSADFGAAPGDHVVVPADRWIDAVHGVDGATTQIVGPTEGRTTLRLVARRLRSDAFRRWWVRSGAVRRANAFTAAAPVTGGGSSHDAGSTVGPDRSDPSDSELLIPVSDWDPEPFDVVVVELLDPAGWSAATGEPVPED